MLSKQYRSEFLLASGRTYVLAMGWVPGEAEALFAVGADGREVLSGSVRVRPDVGPDAETADDAVLLAAVLGDWPADVETDREALDTASRARAGARADGRAFRAARGLAAAYRAREAGKGGK
jgi:hypothetical protein